jgi:hypothetical protein
VADLLFVVITIAFFALCVGYVRLCDRIIGPDPAPSASTPAVGAEREAMSA